MGSRKWNDGRNAFPDPECHWKWSRIHWNEAQSFSGPGNGWTRSEWVGIGFRIRIYVGIYWNKSFYVGMRCNAMGCAILLESISVTCLCVFFAPLDIDGSSYIS